MMMIINTIASIWPKDMLEYCLFIKKLTIFLELRSGITVRFSEQIMNGDKYLSIFSRQKEAIASIIKEGSLHMYKDIFSFLSRQSLFLCKEGGRGIP